MLKREPRCKICSHKDCARIELELASGRSDRKVAAEFGVARDSVRRHWLGNVTSVRKAELIGGPVAVARLAKRAAEEDRSLIDYLAILRSELLHMFLAAEGAGAHLRCGFYCAAALEHARSDWARQWPTPAGGHYRKQREFSECRANAGSKCAGSHQAAEHDYPRAWPVPGGQGSSCGGFAGYAAIAGVWACTAL
jgi:hypothetical protein